MTECFQHGIAHFSGKKPKSVLSNVAEIPMAGLGGSMPVNAQLLAWPPLGSSTTMAWGYSVFPLLSSSNPTVRVCLLVFLALLVTLVFLDRGKPCVEPKLFFFQVIYNM